MQIFSIFLSFLLAASSSLAAFQNVTTLLDRHPDYSTFNSLLSSYGVAPQINSRTTITVLCPPNHVLDLFMSSQGSSMDRQTLFNVLSFHVLLDYEDPAKLRSLAGGFATITTLFQTTGLAAGENGFVNITVTGGEAKIRRPGTSSYAKIGEALEKFPFNISLLAVDEVLVPAGIGRGGGGGGPAPAPVNITQIISQAGNFSEFVSLLVSTGVDKILQDHDTPPGVTIFAPTNMAFNRIGQNTTSHLSSAQLVALLEFHALLSFYPTEELTGSQPTLASGSAGASFSITFSQSPSGLIIIHAGHDNVPIAGTLYSNFPVAIFLVDSVLLPAEIFGAAAPSPTPTLLPPPPPTSPSSTPNFSPASAPSPARPSLSPALVPASSSSPPAPPPDLLSPTNGPEASSPGSPTSSAHVTLASTPLLLFIPLLVSLI